MTDRVHTNRQTDTYKHLLSRRTIDRVHIDRHTDRHTQTLVRNAETFTCHRRLSLVWNAENFTCHLLL